MGRISYEGLFEDWEVRVAKKVINRLIGKWKCLEREGFDDLLQECLFKWYRVKDEYNPLAGANQRTFMARVIENELLHKVEKLTTDKRKASTDAVSLDERVSENEDSPTYADQILGDEDYAAHLRLTVGLKIGVAKVLKKLSPEQQKLCRLLIKEGLNIKEASKALKTPRGTIYDEINRIRAIFEKEGLHDYLK